MLLVSEINRNCRVSKWNCEFRGKSKGILEIFEYIISEVFCKSAIADNNIDILGI